MKRLILMRHAKSDWKNGLLDYDRPLNKRGTRDAPQMAAWLEEQELVPEVILCSAAARTRETHERVVSVWDEPCETVFHETLYHGAPEILFSHIRQHETSCQTIMVLAHNPGIHEAAYRFLSDETAQEAGELYLRFPTAAVAVIDLPITSWGDLQWRTGALRSFQTPRKLDGNN